MQFYTVSDKYINYLRGVDAKVPDNYAGKRPYVGIVLEIGEHKYLAPLTSYKIKQDKLLQSNPTIFKIHEKGVEANKLGMIHLNNMIPILNTEVAIINIAAQEFKYQNLLLKQLEFIKSNQDEIKKKAVHLHKLVTKDKTPHFCQLSCDFSTLELNYRNFGK